MPLCFYFSGSGAGVGGQVVQPEGVALLLKVDSVGGQVSGDFSGVVGKGPVHVHPPDLFLGTEGGKGLIIAGDALVGHIVGHVIGFAFGGVDRDNGLNVKPGVGLAFPDGVDKSAVDPGEVVGVIVAQFVDPKGDIDLAAGVLGQSVQDRDLLPTSLPSITS